MLWSVRSNGPAWIFAHLHIESSGRIFSQFANWEIERPDVSVAHWEIGAANCSFVELSHREGYFLILLAETPGRQIAHLLRLGKRDGEFPEPKVSARWNPTGVANSNPDQPVIKKPWYSRPGQERAALLPKLLSACCHLVKRSRSLFMLGEHHIDFCICRHGDDDAAARIESHDF